MKNNSKRLWQLTIGLADIIVKEMEDVSLQYSIFNIATFTYGTIQLMTMEIGDLISHYFCQFQNQLMVQE